MFRSHSLLRPLFLGGTALLAAVPAFAQESTETVTVTAEKLAAARNGIQTQTGASTYTITAKDIQAQPGGDNAQLNSVVLQMPGVAQDSFGQLHIRGEHNGLQYRLNGIILPEGISVFGQTLDPRLAESVRLITGALPAEYGNRTAGIIDIQTKSGVFEDGGEISLYGGSHSTLSPSIAYGGSSGHFNYFLSGDYTTNTLGIESPDGSNNPRHDRTQQYHGFAYLQDILDQNSSVTAVLGTSNAIFQIPNQVGLQPSGLDGIVGLGPQDPGGNFLLNANGATGFPSENLDERQREITHYGILSYLHSAGSLDYQISAFGRYSSLFFTPGNNIGDVLYDGLAQSAYKRDVAYGLQAEGAWHAVTGHTIRFGLLYQADDTVSRTSSQVLATAPGGAGIGNPNPLCTDPSQTCQSSAVPLTLADNGSKHGYNYGLYIQDEWAVTDKLTVNYGLRYDAFSAFDAENQLSPRINGVWKPTDTTTIHAGYARYFSPPPFELVASNTVALFNNTTAASSGGTNDTPRAERADYYDLGMEQKLGSDWTVGLDSFYKTSKNLIDEGQFGAPIILTPFNYAQGRQYGGELTVNYTHDAFSAYTNASYERAVGKDINSSQFQFDPGDLAFIAGHFIPLDHQQLLSLSAGAAYTWEETHFSADLLYGSGLRKDGATPNGESVPAYVTVNLGVSQDFAVLGWTGLKARFDVINALDEVYEIRDGTGVGVGAPQFGARRGFFVGLSKAL